MAYGTLKVDNITYTSGGSDASTSVSGLVNGSFPNISITGTISGATITGNTGNFTTITAVTGIFTSTLSGATTTGVTANFQSGVFTTQVSGATVAGPTHTGTTANFVSGVFTTQVSGATVLGTTVTGTTANFQSGVFTTRVSGATVTGDSGQFTNVTGGAAGFTSVTGATVTGTTANFSSGVFTTQVSGATVLGTTVTGTTANFVSGVFTTQVSGTTVLGTTITGTAANFTTVTGGTITCNGILTSASGIRLSSYLDEGVRVVAGKLSDNSIDLISGMVHFFTTTETTTSTPNIRFSSTTTLDSVLGVGETVSVTVITTAAAAAFSNSVQIDGSTGNRTLRFQGAAPTAGGASGNDVYTYQIIKTASNTFTVLASVANYA